MRNAVGRFAARWGMLLFGIIVGSGILLLLFSLFVGNNFEVPDKNQPAVISSEGRYTIGNSPKSCPNDINTCVKISVPANETVTIDNVVEAIGISAISGDSPLALRRINSGWEIVLASSSSTLLITASDSIWVLSVS
jgi:hypothetical protein